jgi:hypothetical protein
MNYKAGGVIALAAPAVQLGAWKLWVKKSLMKLFMKMEV